MNDEQLLRYARHILLDSIDIQGQQKLLNSKVLLIGVGGLGCSALAYLGGGGVGHITLVDNDRVELSNLQRQILHTVDRVGMYKAESAKLAIQAINPDIKIDVVTEKIASFRQLSTLVDNVDLVLDCTDNYQVRSLVNEVCVKKTKPLISAAAIKFSGLLFKFNPRNPNDGCYHCLFPGHEKWHDERCSTLGVFSPLVGVMGAMQASLAMQHLLDEKHLSQQYLWMWDAKNFAWQVIKTTRNKDCPICAAID